MEHHVFLNGIFIFMIIFSLVNAKTCSTQELVNTGNCTSDQNNENNMIIPSSDWGTQIHHCVDISSRHIHLCFTPAPTHFTFQLYEVDLLRITDNEGRPTERQDREDFARIKKTKYVFVNLTPGRYRISVSPYDNGLTCKNRYSIPVRCLKTLSGVIEIKGEPTDHQLDTVSSAYTSIVKKTAHVASSDDKEPSTHHKILHYQDFSSTIGFTHYKTKEHIGRSQTTGSYEINQTKGITIKAIAAISGTLSFTLLLAVITACYKLLRKKNSRLSEKSVTEKTVAVISAEDDKTQEYVVSMFALCLQKYYHCKVCYYPWSIGSDKFNWISNTIDKSDFNLFVTSELALNQYNDWKLKRDTSNQGVFIPYLTRVLNRFSDSPFYSQKLIFITFEFSRNVRIPLELCAIQYHLMDDWTKLIFHIHDLQNEFKERNYFPNLNLKRRKEGRIFTNAIKKAAKKTAHARSGSFTEVVEENKLNKTYNCTISNTCQESQVLEESSFGDSSRYFTDNLSICTAVTIAEGVAGFNRNENAMTDHKSKHMKLFSVNKYGEYMEQNIPSLPAFNVSLMDEDNKSKFRENETDYEIRSADLLYEHKDSFHFFVPPEPSLYEDDTNSQYQHELMQSINDNYLASLKTDIDVTDKNCLEST